MNKVNQTEENLVFMIDKTSYVGITHKTAKTDTHVTVWINSEHSDVADTFSYSECHT